MRCSPITREMQVWPAGGSSETRGWKGGTFPPNKLVVPSIVIICIRSRRLASALYLAAAAAAVVLPRLGRHLADGTKDPPTQTSRSAVALAKMSQAPTPTAPWMCVLLVSVPSRRVAQNLVGYPGYTAEASSNNCMYHLVRKKR